MFVQTITRAPAVPMILSLRGVDYVQWFFCVSIFVCLYLMWTLGYHYKLAVSLILSLCGVDYCIQWVISAMLFRMECNLLETMRLFSEKWALELWFLIVFIFAFLCICIWFEHLEFSVLVCILICTFVYLCISFCIFVCLCICICLFVYLYLHICEFVFGVSTLSSASLSLLLLIALAPNIAQAWKSKFCFPFTFIKNPRNVTKQKHSSFSS